MLKPMLLALALACGVATIALAQPGVSAVVYIGTHTGGPGQGIYAARLNEATGELTDLHLAAEVERPTWQEVDPKRPILYSVSETGNDGKTQGGVVSLAIDPRTGKLSPLGKAPSGGGGATFLSYDAPASTLFVGNFGGGQVAAIPVAADGMLSEAASVQTDVGSGPTRRQTGPHAHAAVIDPSGRYVLAPDLGADRVFVYRFDAASRRLSPAGTPFVALPPGSGPRHLVFSRDGRLAFLDTELSGVVYSYRWDARAGRLTPLSSISVEPADVQGLRSAAELALSPDGRFLYVGSRGSNSIVVYAVDPHTGGFTEVQRVASGGQVPWSFRFDPTGRWLLVANEASSQLVSFAADPATGKLTQTPYSLAIPKPVSLSFFQP